MMLNTSAVNVLVIDLYVLTPDRDYGSARMFGVLELLLAAGCRVTFTAEAPADKGHYAENIAAVGVEVVPARGRQALNEYLKENASKYDLVVISRAEVAGRHLATIRECAPDTRVVFDLVDLHYLREYRTAKVTRNLPMLQQALETKKTESDLCRQADAVIVISPAEREVLAQECPEANVHVLSPIHEVALEVSPFSERRDFVFVGGFTHYPNIDAVEFFARNVFPLILREIPGARFHVVGHAPPDQIQGLASPSINVTGYVESVEPYLQTSRVAVVPLRFGAGLKGKVLQSMAFGIPVVGTSVALEGLPFRDGEEVLVADSPADFARQTIKLYSEEALWDMISKKSRLRVKDQFSKEVALKQIQTLIGEMQKK
ncbi:MAG: glycosyltransferase family 4 protein [Verrucomicrobia bacterium]|nr:glycosyltransferase family 4 protein [Verrucomicrobiota bacterium]